MSNTHFYITDSADIYSLDPLTGTEAVVFNSGLGVYSTTHAASTSPLGATSDKVIYISSGSGPSGIEFVIVDTADWTHTTVTTTIPFTPWSGSRLEGTWMDDGCYVWTNRSTTTNDRITFAYDVLAGALRWQEVWARDCRWTSHADALYVDGDRHYQGSISRIDPQDGSLIWGTGQTATQWLLKACAEGVVGASGSDLFLMDKTTGAEIWRVDTSAIESRRLDAGGGRVLTGYGTDGAMIDVANGSVLYEIGGFAGTADPHVGTARVVYCDDSIYAGIGLFNGLSAYDPDTQLRLWGGSYPETPRWIAALAPVPAPTTADATLTGSGQMQPTTASGIAAATLRADATIEGVGQVAAATASGTAWPEQVHPEQPTGPITSPDTHALMVDLSQGRIFFMDAVTGEGELLLNLPSSTILASPSTALSDDETMYWVDTSLYAATLKRLHLLTGESQSLFTRQMSQAEQTAGRSFRRTHGSIHAMAGGDVLWQHRRTETSYEIARFTIDGTELWRRTFEGTQRPYVRYTQDGDRLYIAERPSGAPWQVRRYDVATGDAVTAPVDRGWTLTVSADGLYIVRQDGDGYWTIERYDHTGALLWSTQVSGAIVRSIASDSDRVYVGMDAWSGGYARVASFATATGSLIWENTSILAPHPQAAVRAGTYIIGGTRIDPVDGSLLWQATGLPALQPEQELFTLRQMAGLDPGLLDPTPYIIDGVSRDGAGDRLPATVAAVGQGADGAVSDAAGRWQVSRGSGDGESVVFAYAYSGGTWQVASPVLRRGAT